MLTLKELTNEIFEEIVQCLDLQSILALRLVSRTIAHKASQLTFRSFYRTRHVDFTRTSMESFVRSTTAANPYRHITENLVIRAVGYFYDELAYCVETGASYYNNVNEALSDRASHQEMEKLQIKLNALKALEDEELEFVKKNHPVALLNQGFKNLAGQSGRRMKRLAFEGIVRHDNPTTACHLADLPLACFDQEYLIAGARVFRCTVEALKDCKLKFAEIEIFHELPASLWCGLSYENLAMFSGYLPLAHPLSSPTSLSIRVLTALVEGPDHPCHEEIDAYDTDYDDNDDYDDTDDGRNAEQVASYITEEAYHVGLSALLATCSNLKKLKVPFSDGCAEPYWPDFEIRFRQHAHKLLDTSIPLLGEIYLGGMQFNSVDASAFFLRHRATLRSIELCQVLLEDKPLSFLLLLLASEAFRLENFRLSDMYDESQQRILFDGEFERSYTRISGPLENRNMIYTWGEGTRQTIPYHYSRKSLSDSDFESWRNQREGQFGDYTWW